MNSCPKLAFLLSPSKSRFGVLPLGKDSVQEAGWRIKVLRQSQKEQGLESSLPKLLLESSLCPDSAFPFVMQGNLTTRMQACLSAWSLPSQISLLIPLVLRVHEGWQAWKLPPSPHQVLVKVPFCMDLGRSEERKK